MTDYASMTIDNLIAYRDQWPAQRTEWNRAELALQKRLAVVDELCRLCGELDAEGKFLTSIDPREAYDQGFESGIKAGLSIAAAPLPASPSSVEG